MQRGVLGFDELKTLYPTYLDFEDPWKACKKPTITDISNWLDYFIQYDMLFIVVMLCMPRGSMRDNLINEKHSRGLA